MSFLNISSKKLSTSIKYLCFVIFLLLLFKGVFALTTPNQEKTPITLTYYKLFEPEENLSSLFKEFQKQNPHITVEYRNFTDSAAYLDTIQNHLENGKGADILSVPNTWISSNSEHLSPAPTNIIISSKFKKKFLTNITEDHIFKNKVYGLPLYIDTLAIFYNEKLIDPENLTSWDLLKKLATTSKETTPNLIAIGAGEQINRSADLLILLLLQTDSIIKNAQNNNLLQISPQTDKIYQFLEDFNWPSLPETPSEKEIFQFVTGKTGIIFGYAYLYNNLLDNIQVQQRKNLSTISPHDIKTASTPQFSPENPVFLNNYYSEVVNKNSTHPTEAWQLINFLSNNSKSYLAKTQKLSPFKSAKLTSSPKEIYSPFFKQLVNSSNLKSKNPYTTEQFFKQHLDSFYSSQSKGNYSTYFKQLADGFNNSQVKN